MGEIKWSEKASSNLQAIFDYISRDSRLYAARYVKALIKATKKLEKMPRCGRMVPEFENRELREVIYRNHRWVLDSNSAILALAAHLRQAVTQELAATSGKYGEEPAPVYEEDS